MAIFGLVNQVDQIQEAIKEKNVGMIALRFTQLICMLFGLTSQCFTGDTLVATETGLRPIAEIEAGDYVWSENTETGEKALKQVLSVSVTETTVLVHITTEDGTEINTTENHPFYVEEKGWCAAADLEAGDHLHTQDGRIETVLKTETEQLKEAVKVYNMEIEDWHTYYVSDEEVLVHNGCKGRLGNEKTRKQNKEIADTLKDKGYEITGGGTYEREEYLPGPNNKRKGSNYIDITAEKDGVKVRINTVDTYASGEPTTREKRAAKQINLKLGDEEIILIPKGAGVGNLLELLGIE